MKVETDIISSIAARPMDELWKLMSVETFKTDYCFYWLHHNAFEVTLTDDCQYQSQSDDTENVKIKRKILTMSYVKIKRKM